MSCNLGPILPAANLLSMPGVVERLSRPALVKPGRIEPHQVRKRKYKLIKKIASISLKEARATGKIITLTQGTFS